MNVQVPSFILGGDTSATQESSLSLSGSTPYSLTLTSYLQGLGETMTPTASSGSVKMEELGRGLVNMADTESASEHPLHGHLLQMVAFLFIVAVVVVAVVVISVVLVVWRW